MRGGGPERGEGAPTGATSSYKACIGRAGRGASALDPFARIGCRFDRGIGRRVRAGGLGLSALAHSLRMSADFRSLKFDDEALARAYGER